MMIQQKVLVNRFKNRKRCFRNLRWNHFRNNKFFINLWKGAGAAGLNFLNIIPKLISTSYNFITDIFVSLFSSMYETKIEEKELENNWNHWVYNSDIGCWSLGYTVIENYKSKGNEVVVEKRKVIKKKRF